MLSGPGAFPFIWLLDRKLDVPQFDLWEVCQNMLHLRVGRFRIWAVRWVEFFIECLCSVNNSAPVYCQQAVIHWDSCKSRLSAEEFCSFLFWSLFPWFLLELFSFCAFWDLDVVSFPWFCSVLLLQPFLELTLVVGDSFLSPSDLGFLWRTSWLFSEELRTLWLSLPEVWRCCCWYRWRWFHWHFLPLLRERHFCFGIWF